ncbi:MAG: aminotransferase class I/II-fold pyridoxal phosphate-dependent enzyme [Clostridiales bacterium]|nr:aminotransferase class I/II-fold pyridoxal phosphate-dependent enzyme [Clostridiales bacterium]
MRCDFVAEKIKGLPFSGIRKFFNIASELQDVISLGVGEPDFDTPWNIRDEAIYRLEVGSTVYTSNAGMPELLHEISRYMRSRFELDYDPANQIICTVGASEGIDAALRAIINPGDEVLIAEPCFVSYYPCVIMAGGVPVTITTRREDEFRLTPQAVEEKITPRTKALIMCYPNNPTGAVMNSDDLLRLANCLRDRDIVVLSDEIYAELTYDGESPARHTSIASFPHMKEKTIVLNGFSKTFAMTGWRLGFACGPCDIINAILKIHQYALMCAPTISQYAGIEALKSGAGSVLHMRNEYDERRRVMVKELNGMGLDCFEPRGAFYVFPSIQSTGMTSEEFCTQLLYSQKVAVVPGDAFGESGNGFVRISYATGMDDLQEALRRIKVFLDLKGL